MRTSLRLEALGQKSIAVPVLSARQISPTESYGSPHAIVFTSVNGVRFHERYEDMAEVPVFTVGNRTARAARECGYRNVHSADGDVTDLEQLVRAHMPIGSDILHLSARAPAGDLVNALVSAKYEARRVSVYATQAVPRARLDHVLSRLREIDGILIHSPRAAAIVADALRNKTGFWPGRAICISPAAASAFEIDEVGEVQIAERPTESALLNLVKSGHENILPNEPD